MANRTDERKQFLTDLLVTAVEHCGYGQFSVSDYRDETGDDGLALGEAYADIIFHESGPEGGAHRVTIDTMAKGLRVIREAVLGPSGPLSLSPTGQTYRNRETGERLYFGGHARSELLLADRTNGDKGDYDVIGALAVLECALFGRVVYG